jgi:Tfp pilus assembly protein PilO
VTEGAKQYGMVLGGGAVAIALLLFLAVVPARMKLGSAQAQLAGTENEVVQRQQRLRPLGRLTERVGQLEKELRSGHKTLPHQSELGTFLGRISRIVDNQRLTDLEITPGQLVSKGSMFRMPMKLTFCGSLAGVFAFLREMEALPHYTRVDELKLENDARYKGRLTVSLGISVFFQSDEQKQP